MDDGALIETMLDHYRDRFDGWNPPARGVLTDPRGGFSGGPYGLAVRYVVVGNGDGAPHECVWLETSRMMVTALMRIAADGDGRPELLGEMQTMYMLGPTDEDTTRERDRMHARNAAFWGRVGALGLDRELPLHTVVNAHLTSAAADTPPLARPEEDEDTPPA